MAITTVYTYALNGTAKDFNIPFEYLARRFITVTLIGVDRKELALTTDYRFTSKTAIQTTKAWSTADGYDLIEVRRNTSATDRLVDFADGSILRAYELNTAQIQTMHIAEEARNLVADTIGVNNEGMLDARARRIVNLGDAINPGDAVTLRQEQAWGNSALNQAGIAKNEADRSTARATESANSAAAAKTSENNAAASKTAAQTSETNAKTSETNSSANTAKAQKWADEAVDVAVETGKFSSKHHATKSANSASASQTSANNAKTSETNAKTSENNAAAHLTEMKNRNYGALASDPTVRPDGTAMAAGDFYFNTASSALRKFDGTTWSNFSDASAYTKGEADAKFADTAGDTFTGEIRVAPSGMKASLVLSGSATHDSFEIGRTDGVASTPYLDFHSGATAVDYDCRLIASGGNGTAGNGELIIYARAVNNQNPAFHVEASSYMSSVGGTITDDRRIGKASDLGGTTLRYNRQNCFSTTTGRFTAAVGGFYFFAAQFTRSGGNFRLDILKNGVSTTAGILSYGADWQTASISAVVLLAAGDYVEALGQAVNGTTVSTYSCNFNGHLIG